MNVFRVKNVLQNCLVGDKSDGLLLQTLGSRASDGNGSFAKFRGSRFLEALGRRVGSVLCPCFVLFLFLRGKSSLILVY